MSNSDYKILLVDDEPDILEFLGYNLRKEEYVVFTASDGAKALEIARKEKPHLIVLDVMMPGMDGIETCVEMKKLDELKDSLIIFLTARSEDYSQVAGYDAGADDYISKPIKPRLLNSKIKALLRRYVVSSSQQTKSTEVLQISDLVIDKEEYIVRKGEQEIGLPKKEFELLYLLASKPNKVFTRDEIFSRIWGEDIVVGERTIDVHIRKLRERLDIDNIKTVKGVGYKIEI